ncbi:MAG: hypothetical protein R2795_23325 [Saprospiraceae bacterium]
MPVDKNSVVIDPQDVKVADPAVAFIVRTSTNEPFDCPVTIFLTVTSAKEAMTVPWILQPVVDDHLHCLMPFGDNQWETEKGGTVAVQIKVRLNNGSNPIALFNFPEVLAQDGEFVITVK